MGYSKIIILVLVILLGCTVTRSNNNESYEEGIILISSLKIDYFFPFDETELNEDFSFGKQNYENGFLLTGLNIERRFALIRDHSLVIESDNHPFTHIIPVKIKYSYADVLQNSETDSISFTLDGYEKTFYYDSKFRNILEIIPLNLN